MMRIQIKNKRIRMFLGTFLLMMVLLLAKPEVSYAKMNVKNYNRWMKTCQTMLTNMKKYKFRYSNSGIKSYYKKAVRSARKTNCANYVSWCLQEYGALKRGKTFYVSSSGKIRKNFGSWGSKVKLIKVYKKCTSVKLQPGDVVCWKSASHVNVYAGRSKSGKRLWYDGGKVSTASNSNGSRYTNTKKRYYGYLNSRKISYIIRIKNLYA